MKTLSSARMKFPPGRIGQVAFTLPELMVAMAIFGMVMAGMMMANAFGIRAHELTKVKLGASDEARRAINLLSSEVRAAKIIRIGNGTASSFTEIPLNSLQRGSAIQIHPTTNTANFVRYFWNSGDHQLKRSMNGSNIVTVVANFITNQMVFTSEDGFGNILTNNQNNRVVGLKLEFYQLQYPVVKIGPGQLYDYYCLSTKTTRRALE